MTAAVPRASARPGSGDPTVDARLARLHLRLGQIELARAELEALAGTSELDGDTLLALAEARWRTGDLPGAGEAAQACLDGGRNDTLALVIAAEATAAVGRPGEARRLAGLALDRTDESIDAVFAGIPRSLIWPADPSEAGQPAGVLFPEPDPGATGAGSVAAAAAAASAARDEHARADAIAVTRDQPLTPTGPGLWDQKGAPRITGAELPDAQAAIAAATAALADGRFGDGAVHLAIALRLASALAPTVLELVEASERRTPELELVRGDAYRVAGHELEARRAYAIAATGVVRDRRGWRSEDRK
jgi:tetratricopeptide (TPR) repeat protein